MSMQDRSGLTDEKITHLADKIRRVKTAFGDSTPQSLEVDEQNQQRVKTPKDPSEHIIKVAATIQLVKDSDELLNMLEIWSPSTNVRQIKGAMKLIDDQRKAERSKYE